jgi:hypothetical protein
MRAWDQVGAALRVIVSAVAQQPNKDDRGGGANLCRKRRSASRLPAMATPAGQGAAALSSVIGGLATGRVGRRTAKRFGGQAASAGFGRSRS